MEKKFGYHCSPHLTSQGIVLHLWKALLSEKSRKVSLGRKVVALATMCNANLQEAEEMSKREVQKQVGSVQ